MGCPSWTENATVIWLCQAQGDRGTDVLAAPGLPHRGGTDPSPRGRLCVPLALIAQKWACVPAADPKQIYWVILGCY